MQAVDRQQLTALSLTNTTQPPSINMNSSDAPASSTAIHIRDAAVPDARGKLAPAAVAPATPFYAFFRKTKAAGGSRRGIAVFDFLLRLLTIGAILSATIAMGTADETLPFFSEYFQFHANYSNFPQFTFFVIGNAVAAGYLLLSLPFSIAGMCQPRSSCALGLRFLLLACDVVMVALTSAAAATATAIVYLAHEGNSSANWVAICMRLEGFCQQTSGAVIASFVAVVFFVVLVVMSALALRKH